MEIQWHRYLSSKLSFLPEELICSNFCRTPGPNLEVGNPRGAKRYEYEKLHTINVLRTRCSLFVVEG